MIKLVWEITGDYFEIEPYDVELASWYVDQCDAVNSGFTIEVFETDEKHISVDVAIREISSDIATVNSFLEKIKMSKIVEPKNYYNHIQLNQLHKDWVGLIKKYPTLRNMFKKLDENVFNSFDKINRFLHVIENQFKYKMRARAEKYWIINNPFKEKLLHDFPTGNYNVMMSYVDYGRSSWEKFINGDITPNDIELSQWEYIGSTISIDLRIPRSYDFPNEFLNYCASNYIQPVGINLPFGNVKDYEKNLTDAKIIMERNVKINGNLLEFKRK